MGVVSSVLEIQLLSKTAKFPFQGMDYSPWSSKFRRNSFKECAHNVHIFSFLQLVELNPLEFYPGPRLRSSKAGEQLGTKAILMNYLPF